MPARHRYACRVSKGEWWGCKEQGTLDHDSVYTKSVILVDGTWPNKTALGSCHSDPGLACYSACNQATRAGEINTHAPSAPPS